MAYINANWDNQALWAKPYHNGYWGDSRLEANEEIAKRFLQITGSEEWLNSGSSIQGSLNY